jgi:uncharacterized protein YbcI
MSEVTERTSGGSLNAAITNETVRILTAYTGRGAERARTVVGANVVTVILEKCLTKAELALAHAGRAEQVRNLRHQFQEVMRDDLVGAVERLTGRKVIGFLSDQQIEPDVSSEVFVLNGPVDGSTAEATTD